MKAKTLYGSQKIQDERNLNQASIKRSLRSISCIALALVSLTLASCGKQEFLKQTYQDLATAAGYQSIPGKVDIVLIVDNTPSFGSPSAEFNQRLPQFIQNLSSQNWNYRIASTPIYGSRSQSLGTILYNSTDSLEVPSGDATRDPARFSTYFPIDSSAGNYDQTFLNLRTALSNESRRFIRNDALLVFIVLSNGDDTSGCYGFNCSGSPISSWAQQLQYAANNKAFNQIRFYPIVAQTYSYSCWGSTAGRGSRYLSMAQYFSVNPSSNLDLCLPANSNMTNLVNDLASQITATKREYVQTAIALAARPVETSIHIYKLTPNGQGGYIESEIPRQNALSGWTYDTQQTTTQSVYTVTEPTPTNPQTGYIIELHGEGQIRGDQKYRITYERL